MKPLIYLALILTLFSCQETGSVSGPSLSLDGFDEAPIPGSQASYVYRNDSYDRILEEGIIVNGKREGLWITYHDNEKQIPKVMASYVNGKLNGAYTEFNTRGGITLLKHYVNDVLDGKSIEFKNGRLVEVANYRKGQYHGMVTTYFERSDQKQTEAQFKAGKQDGLLRYYNEEGQVVMEYVYENGEKVSGGMIETPESEEK
ncbi:MAG: hypothetical protein GYB31_20505 [Bacteroidetes bacterium]|nr:hypothetical protein [Bacteroidota bacterium]